eukprot:scaffold13977_cov120-Cylindrotheca_fusiformis.AAC.2
MKLYFLLATALFFGVSTSTDVSAEADTSTRPSVMEESLQETLQEAKQFLQAGSSSNEKVHATVEGLSAKALELENLQSSLDRKQESVDKLVREANARQLQVLASRLNETLKKELKLRSSIKLQTETIEEASVPIDTVSISDVKKRLDVSRIMDQSEAKIQTWMLEIMKDEVEKYRKELLANSDVKPKCPSTVDVVQDVHMALTKFSQDGIGLLDHAQGGQIVHTLTSPTYSPEPDPEELLGNVW